MPGLPHVFAHSRRYDETLQVAVRATDRSRPYWAASPSNGNLVDDPERGLFIQRWGDSNDARYGDAHIYPQFGRTLPGHGGAEVVDCEDLSKFQTARFVSEYGFISMESWASMASMTQPEDLTADGNSSQLFFRMRQDWPANTPPPSPDPVPASQPLGVLLNRLVRGRRARHAVLSNEVRSCTKPERLGIFAVIQRT